MRYSIEPRDRIYAKDFGFLSFAKNIGTHATKVAKNISNKYSQKILAEETGDLIGNKISDKMTSISKSPKEFYSQNASNEFHSKTNENEIEIPKERYIFPEKRQQTIDELRLV